MSNYVSTYFSSIAHNNTSLQFFSSGIINLKESLDLSGIAVYSPQGVLLQSYGKDKYNISFLQNLNKQLSTIVEEEGNTFVYVYSPVLDKNKNILMCCVTVTDISKSVRGLSQTGLKSLFLEIFLLFVMFVTLATLYIKSNFERDRFLTLSSQIPLGVLYLDNHFNIQYFNVVFSDYFEVSLYPESKKLSLYDLIRDRDLLSNFLQKKESQSMFTSVGIDYNKKEFPIRVFLKRLTDSNNIVGIVEDIALDIQTKNLDISLSKMQSMATAAAGVAHNYNNQFAIISLGIETIKTKLLSFQNSMKINQILINMSGALDNAINLTNQFMLVSSQGNLNKSWVDLVNICKNAESVFRTQLKTTGVSLVFEYNPDEDYSVLIDSTNIQYTLLNMLTNSKESYLEKYKSDPDSLRKNKIRIVLDKVLLNSSEELISENGKIPNGNYITLSVEDCGIGFNKNHIKKCFDPFFTTKGFYNHLGLGLSLVWGFVNSHNSFIKIDSDNNKTVITIFFPINIFDTTRKLVVKKELKTVENIDFNTLYTKSILIAEDIPDLAKGLQDILRSFCPSNVKIDIAYNGKEALDFVFKNNYDLLLTDMVMPIMNGYELFNEIIKLENKPEVIILSGFDSDANILDMLNKGAKKFLRKPYNRVDLEKEVLEVLK